jgi:hypothetical protein
MNTLKKFPGAATAREVNYFGTWLKLYSIVMFVSRKYGSTQNKTL